VVKSREVPMLTRFSWELPSWVPGKLPDAPADACAACGASWTDADDAGCDLLMVGRRHWQFLVFVSFCMGRLQ
jgi:hypothetical protein